MTSASDTFQRADGGLGANWTPWSWSGAAAAQIASLAATGGSGTTSGDYWTASSFTPNQVAQVTIGTVPPGGSWTGVTVRQSGAGTGYLGLWFSGQFFLFNENGTGGPPQIGSAVAGALSAGDTIGISAVGTTITVLHNGSPVITATDSTYASGQPGIAFFGTGQSVTAWGASDIVTVSTASLANVAQNTAIRRWLTATGGTPPYTWAVTAGSLPAGITLRSDGKLSGTPTGTGASSFTVQATDSASGTATKALSITSVSAPLAPGTPSTDGNGVVTWHVTSAINFNDAESIRVLSPVTPDPDRPHGFLVTLPVAAGTDDTSFGNGLDTARALGLHNTYNLTIIEPSTGGAWLADNPSNSALLQETYLLQVAAWAKANFGSGPDKVWLIGFSRTGISGQAIFLKWTDVFAGMASWDYPAAMTTFDGQDPHGTVGGASSASYGTQDNFAANYQLSPANMGKFLDGTSLASARRVWAGGYFAFQADVADGNANLTTAGILHAYAPVAASAHNWAPTPGWVGIAVPALLGLAADAHLAAAPVMAAAGDAAKTGAAHLAAAPVLAGAGSVAKTGQAHLSAAGFLAAGATLHPLHSGTAALSAAAALTCSTTTVRITITPSTVSPGSQAYGPLVPDSYVVVPAVIDGIYDSWLPAELPDTRRFLENDSWPSPADDAQPDHPARRPQPREARRAALRARLQRVPPAPRGRLRPRPPAAAARRGGERGTRHRAGCP